MRVALTQRVATAPNGEIRDCLDQRWAELLEPAGMLPLPLPTAIVDVGGYLDALAADAVILTGGNDLASVEDCRDPTPARDRFERHVIAWCEEQRVPLVGVCRGMQMLAARHGVPLRRVDGHVGGRHRVSVAAGRAGDNGSHNVNTFHTYVIRASDLPLSLRPFAWDDDGNVEAFEHRELPQFAIMWHPEREAERETWARRVLFDLIGAAVRG
jgi:N5-(cytidine 5'-diphosphoramidyl)-L-glutamine hydrolase